jgi:RNA polymerase sigma factor (sigma-70 family)
MQKIRVPTKIGTLLDPGSPVARDPAYLHRGMQQPLPGATIDAFRRGEGAAFAEVMRAYSDVVRGAAARFFSTSVFDQEEAMQEIWLHIWKNRSAVDPSRAAELSGFIAVTARRKCIDILRKKDPAAAAVAAADDDAVDAVADVATAGAADVARDREVTAAARTFADARLKEGEWRSFFDLHFVQGLSFEEVGARLGIGKLRCKYLKKVIASRAREDPALLAVLRPGEA